MRQLNKNLYKMTGFLIIIITLFTTASLALAQEGARVYLQPVESAEGQLTVEVIAENVTEMYGAEFQLKYDPAMVAVQDAAPNQEGIQIEPGSLLPADQGFMVANQVNEAEGTVVFALTLLNPAPPVSGSGPLARVTFNVLQAGPTTLNVERAKLVAINLQTIPSQTASLTIGNNAEQQQPESSSDNNASATISDIPPTTPDSSNFPWWIIAAGILILGLLGLGAFVAMVGFSKPQKTRQQAQTKRQTQIKRQTQTQQPQPKPQPPVQKRPQHVPGTRPSAFK